MCRIPQGPPEVLLGKSEVETCLPVEKCILPGVSLCERLTPGSLVCDSNLSAKSRQCPTSREVSASPASVAPAHKCCKHHYMVLFVDLLGIFSPLTENLIPLLGKKLLIFS